MSADAASLRLLSDGRVDWEEIESVVASLAGSVAQSEQNEVHPREAFARLARSGLLKAAFSKNLECQIEFFDALRHLSKHWISLAESLHLQVLSLRGVFAGATDRVFCAVSPDLLNGEAIIGNCFSERAAGSDLNAIQTRAIPDGDHYRIVGEKMWVGHAPIADYFSVWCKIDRGGSPGLTGFLVPANSGGVSIGPPIAKIGARALPTASVAFNEVRVPQSSMLGKPHRGILVSSYMLNWGRLGISSCAVGLAEAALERAVEYAKQRTQFGKPVIEHQGLAFGLADVACGNAAARALVTDAITRTVHGQGTTRVTAQAKLFATDNAMSATGHAMQVLSAYGYLEEEPVSRWFREAKLFQIIDGTNHLQRQMIASTL